MVVAEDVREKVHKIRRKRLLGASVTRIVELRSFDNGELSIFRLLSIQLWVWLPYYMQKLKVRQEILIASIGAAIEWRSSPLSAQVRFLLSAYSPDHTYSSSLRKP